MPSEVMAVRVTFSPMETFAKIEPSDEYSKKLDPIINPILLSLFTATSKTGAAKVLFQIRVPSESTFATIPTLSSFSPTTIILLLLSIASSFNVYAKSSDQIILLVLSTFVINPWNPTPIGVVLLFFIGKLGESELPTITKFWSLSETISFA